jgi:hypothetical protein
MVLRPRRLAELLQLPRRGGGAPSEQLLPLEEKQYDSALCWLRKTLNHCSLGESANMKSSEPIRAAS